MCGICGYITKQDLSPSHLTVMRDTIAYRGPDDAGNWYGSFKGYNIGLAHRRLSIMDLSELGHQPMRSGDNRYVIVYNGEIYNHRELREELQEHGYVFRSGCDTEIFLYAFALWKEDCFAKINGMFGVAIWDTLMGIITIARDRVGKKPLYYYYNRATKDFVFASELKPIMKFPGFEKEINRSAISDYFCNTYIAAPNTIFENTFKMLPGSWLRVSLTDSHTHRERYWNPIRKKNDLRRNLITDPNEAVDELEIVLKDSIKRRMVADVPVGAFLSGGIDSTVVTALAQRQSDLPIKTFSIGFHNRDKDEAPFAKEVARFLGTDHTEMYLDDDELLQVVPQIVRAYDEPMSDSSQIPSLVVSELASGDVKVVLTGDGGDEIFCGYNMYDWVWLAQRLDVPGRMLSVIPGIRMAEFLPAEVRAFINNDDFANKTQLFTDVRAYHARKILCGGIIGDVKYEYEKNMRQYENWQERRMLLDLMTYMPDEILCKMDRASMYHSLEARCPLLDYRVIELSFRIFQKLKYKHFEKKSVLKELTYKYVPRKLLDRPKKGFSPPIREWVRGPLSKQFAEYASRDSLTRQGIFDWNGIDRLIRQQKKTNNVTVTTTLWSFFVFQEWYRTYMEDLW